ncbi:metallo-beta-lactamase domain-containing protein 1 [Taeniopygia guttata]|uniref:metallo-beta-lactamase domain-containing protein 1 n=1 Tax=Taeniopygia guttata TaxID=59729 RepID=UPI003BB88032
MPRGFRTSPLGSLTIPGPLYSIHILHVGYNRPEPDGSTRADGSVTLVRGGPLTVLVDTGGPWLRQRLPELLGHHGVVPEEVTHVVVTHGHSDHAGNLNLFPRATMLVGFDLSRGEGLYLPHGLASGAEMELHPGHLWDLSCGEGLYLPHGLASGAEMELHPGHLWVMPTPGHTRAHVSLLAAGTALGTVAVAGDVFEHGEDEEQWAALSEEPRLQRHSRRALAGAADVVVPGHGEPFRIFRETQRGQEEEGEREEEEEEKEEEEEEEKEEEEEGVTSRHGGQ